MRAESSSPDSPDAPRAGAAASDAATRLRVPLERLTTRVDSKELGFATTEELPPLEGTIGQDRAIRALEFGLRVQTPGYNVFVTGMPGTGRNTTLASYLEQVAGTMPAPNDWCYVYNFQEQLKPRAVRLPTGMGRQLAADMDDLVREARRRIPLVFESTDYQRSVAEAGREILEKQRSINQEMEEEAKRRGVTLAITSAGVVATPLDPSGKPLERDSFERLSEEEQAELRNRHEGLLEYIQQRSPELRRLEKQAGNARQDLDKSLVIDAISPLFEDLKAAYHDLPDVLHYLDLVQVDMGAHVQLFRGDVQPPSPGEALLAMRAPAEDEWVRYRVNVLVSHEATEGAPVIFEASPTYYNVFGRVDHELRMGAMSTNFTQVRPGALHRASGGFLVLQARDVLASPFVWQALKQSLRSGQARMETLGDQMNAVPTSTLTPEPIPCEAKIVLVGNPYLFRLLLLNDEDFHKFFKVKADFATSMDLDQENVRKYASFIVNRVQAENLRHFDAGAVARVVEHSSRLVEDQGRLTTRFSDVAALVTEADYWAGKRGNGLVTGKDVEQAIAEQVYRSNLVEEQLQELYQEGTFQIDVDGAVVGQVNGLAVIDMGDYSFGKPSRITARVSLGRGEFSNIDQDSRLGGPVHGKGFQILLGYLMGKYGVDNTLPIRASITFEQTYNEVDGDSASSAELYALLSSMANVPIRQGLAVTGSVDQRGEVQAVGGVTRKVEGFYEVCKAQGLTGEQGVIIPGTNVRNLVLKGEVVEAIRRGDFQVYAANTIEEGMELLTGVPSAAQRSDGSHEPGSLDDLIHRAIARMRERTRAVQRTAVHEERVVRTEVVSPATPAEPTDSGRAPDRREGDGDPPNPPPT